MMVAGLPDEGARVVSSLCPHEGLSTSEGFPCIVSNLLEVLKPSSLAYPTHKSRPFTVFHLFPATSFSLLSAQSGG